MEFVIFLSNTILIGGVLYWCMLNSSRKPGAAATIIGFVADRSKRHFHVDAFFVFFTLFLIQGVISFIFGLAEIPRTYDLLDKMVKIWVLCLIMKTANRDRLQIHAMVIV